eukprot:CAMPEP_0172818554 /NCGR_PEP_ID=MMETSP1075-20121228/13997_1 /TAXON_ID=2916 /ORGANISM="Ceratium fusus, Strain PA161109" /LENGTH=150 /DNA_ID=CAMNT_0013658929 /DNA_START=54 /DNA_END=505 /DNA_ORIENTATION=-
MAYVLARRVQHWRVNRYASAVATQQSMPVVSPQSLGWQVNLQARAAPSAQELLMRAPKLHSTKVSSNLYAVTERISPDTAKTQVLRGDAADDSTGICRADGPNADTKLGVMHRSPVPGGSTLAQACGALNGGKGKALLIGCWPFESPERI